MNGTRTNLNFKRCQIDEEQPETVESHYKLIMADDSLIVSNHRDVTPDDLPDWLDDKLFKIGQDYYTRNILSMSSAYLTSLFAVLLVPDISKFLVATKRSSTPCTAFRRYLQTLLHIYNLHTHNYRNPDSKFYKSLSTVCWKHSINSKLALARGDLGITQRQMVLTQASFICYVLANADEMAFTNRPEEREGINHFWRVLGRLFGIPDRLNACRKNERETTQLCTKIRDEIYANSLRAPNDDFFLLVSAAVDGLQCVDVMLDMDAMMEFFCEINGCQSNRKMGFYSKYNYLYRKFMFFVMRQPIIGPVVRSFWNVYFRGCYWVQERFPFVAWMKYGKKQSEIVLYPPLTCK